MAQLILARTELEESKIELVKTERLCSVITTEYGKGIRFANFGSDLEKATEFYNSLKEKTDDSIIRWWSLPQSDFRP